MNEKSGPNIGAGRRSPIDALLESFTTNTARIHTILGYPGVMLLLAVLFAGLVVAPGFNRDPAIIYLVVVALLGSVLTYLAEWYFNLRMATAKADMLRSYQKMLIEKFLPQEVRLQDVQAVIRDIISPMLGLEEHK